MGSSRWYLVSIETLGTKTKIKTDKKELTAFN
jgi:hypothetical protein